MKVSLKEYSSNSQDHSLVDQEPGPIITVSRSYGCDEQPFINSLINHLNQQAEKTHPWRDVSNQIIKKTSRALHMEPIDVENRVMDYSPVDHNRNGRSHQSETDLKVMKTIRKLMVDYAYEGNVLFVGRGGKSVLHDMPNSLHLKLTAPIGFRTEQVAKKMKMRTLEAEEMIYSIDNRRIIWTEHLIDRPFDESDFDLILNAATFSIEQMVAIVLQVMPSSKSVDQ